MREAHMPVWLGDSSRRRRKKRVVAGVAALLAIALPVAPTRSFAQAALNEYQVKAAFLYNFARFVEWPAGTFASASSSFKFCVFGKDPFGKSLEEALAGKRIAEHRVELVRARKISELEGCQVVFVSASDSVRPFDVVAGLKSRNVLLVGEEEDFASAGGTIQFFLQDNRVRFVINPDAASRAGLKVSSKLLALANVVRDSSAGGRN